MATNLLYDGHDYLTALLNATVDGIIAIDAAGTIVDANPATTIMFGYEVDQMIGNNVSMLMPEPDRSHHDKYIKNYLGSGDAKIIGIGREVRGQRSDGTIFPMHLAVGEFSLEGARMFTGIVRDVSRTHALREELAHAQRLEAIGQLTGGIAHDFNNLLAIIQGNLELMEPTAGDAGEFQDLVGDALEAVELGAELTGRLLAFARRQPLEPRIIELSGLVIDMTDLLQRTLGGGIDIDVRIGADPGRVMVDPGQMQNALLNLAINSRDAMPGGGHLEIQLSSRQVTGGDLVGVPDGDYVSLSISDNGCGMSEEVRSRAFDPFFTTKEKGSGTGLGLSQVYGFVKQSGGHTLVSSKPGNGTKVTVLLPSSADGSAVRQDLIKARIAPLDGVRVLVVEDDPKVRKNTVRRLKKLKCIVFETESGERALDLLRDGLEADLVFTDVVMPGMTGPVLADAIGDLLPHLPVLFTSGFAADVLAEYPNSRSSKMLRKPYSSEELARAVVHALGR